jgi:hypothetical protein
MMSYVNLKYFAEFNKYTMALGAGSFLYFEKFDAEFRCLRTLGIILAAFVVLCGVVIMSVSGRIEGDSIDYKQEKDPDKLKLFKIMSRTLFAQIIILVVVVIVAGWMSLAKIWA